MLLYVDKTIINLTTIIISGAGLFTVLTKFNVPQIHHSFWGHNPYTIKSHIIDGVMTKIFIIVALSGFMIQTLGIIFADSLQERMYSTRLYVIITIVLVAVMTFIVFLLTRIGNITAKRKWFPKMIESQYKIFEKLTYIVEHDGLQENEYIHKDRIEKIEEIKSWNLQQAKMELEQIEDLLEISSNENNINIRIEKLKKYFDNK